MRNSEDVVTREFGGSLGGVKATQLPDSFLDALAVLKPGEVSEVIETPFGFHVLKMRSVPKPEAVGGQRLVIAYDNVVRLPGQKQVTRSRSDALNLARDVENEARAGNSSFEALVGKYSDSLDVAQAGDFGVWSLADPEYFGREVEMLGTLKVGEVAQPMDSKFGVEILKRTEADARPQYAMTSIRLKFTPDAPDSSTSSKQAAKKLARDLLKKLKKDPAVFDELQKQYCCADEVQQWAKGRGPIGLSEFLDKLKLGQVASGATIDDVFVVIPKRLDPSALAPLAEPIYELPAPKGPDFEAMIRYSTGESLAASVRKLRSEAPAALKLVEEPQRGNFIAVLDRLAEDFVVNDEPEKRLQAARLTREEMKQVLGPQKFQTYQAFLNAWASSLMLGAAR